MRNLRQFRTHLEILKHSHPELVVQLAPEPRGPSPVELSGADDSQALKWNGKCLHSPKAPDAEAQRLLESFAFENNRVYVIFGAGLGHLPRRALEKLPAQSSLIVFEPDLRVFREVLGCVDLRAILFDPRAVWVSGPKWREHLLIHLRHAEKAGRRPSTAILSLPAYRTFFEATLYDIRSRLAQFINERVIDTQTRKTLTDLWNRNLTENLPYILDSTPLNLLTTTFKGVPFILVGAGPSLDDNLEAVSQLKSRALIAAVDTALAPLLRAGCDPDVVVAMDAQEENARDFAGVPPHSSILVYDAFCFPSIVPMYPPDRRIVSQTGHVLSDIDDLVVVKNGLLPLFDHLLDYEYGFLQSGGSVITCAFDLARIAGCSAVGLVGVDFSLPGYLTHSKLTNKFRAHIGEQSRFETLETSSITGMSQRSRLRLDGAAGKDVWSDRVLVLYKHWMEDASARSGIPCFRIGPHRGAKLTGYEPIGVDDFLTRFGVERADIESRLGRCRGARPSIKPDDVRRRLTEFRNDLARLDRDSSIDRVGPFDLDRFVAMTSMEISERLTAILELEPESEHPVRRQQASRACRDSVAPFLDRFEAALNSF